LLMLAIYYFGFPPVSAALFPTSTPTLRPTWTPTPLPPTATPTVTLEPCPTDPEGWTLVDVVPGDNYKRIEPTCAYAGLERAVAWALAINLGYTRAEAAQALGFETFPMVRLGKIKLVTNFKGPMEVRLRHTVDHPDFAEWRVDANKEPAIAYSLRGCFRTYTIVGNRREDWGTGYPVICVVAQDIEGMGLSSLNEYFYMTGNMIFSRTFTLFGYAGNGKWIWLGDKDAAYPIEDADRMRKERQDVAGRYGAVVWDAAWIEQTFRLSMRPLPENWQYFNHEADKQAILDILNTYSASQGGSP